MQTSKKVVDNMTKGSNKEDTQLNYTKEWVSIRTQGGLCLVNDVTFLFFSRLEGVVKQQLLLKLCKTAILGQ